MGATGSFKHIGVTTGVTALGTAYTSAYAVTMERVLIHSSCFIQLSTIAGGAANTTVRITSDAAGNVCLVPDTTAAISLGVGDATQGSAVYKTDIILPSVTDTVYVWVKVDAGSAVLSGVTVTGVE